MSIVDWIVRGFIRKCLIENRLDFHRIVAIEAKALWHEDNFITRLHHLRNMQQEACEEIEGVLRIPQ